MICVSPATVHFTRIFRLFAYNLFVFVFAIPLPLLLYNLFFLVLTG